ncbi:MAG: patatin-like phospholipase family protein [Acidobacteriota bacterium]
MSTPNDPCQRMLLSQVLLEEYASLEQPRLNQNEKTIIEEAIHAVIRSEHFEGHEPEKLAVIYADLAGAYETLLYSKMAADFERNFASRLVTDESKTEQERRESALDRLNDIGDRMIDAYGHAIALIGDDPKQTAWMEALTVLCRRHNQDTKTVLDKIVARIREPEFLPSEHLSKAAEALHGEIVKRIYALMAAAQKSVASEQCKLKEKHWEWVGTVDRAAVKRTAIADIFGRVDDLRDKHEAEQKEAAPTAEKGDLSAKTKEIDEKILTDLRNEDAESAEWAPGVKGTGSGKTKAAKELTIEDAQRKLAQTYRSALCLSGGGIRSAIFNLGILQGLARHGLLEKFDYLSTVSGGGFSGGWLTAWMYRDGLGSVINQLKDGPKSPLKPEPGPLEHLRVYSNFLSPQPGLLSADTWTLVASLLRNLMLNWLVFIPVLMTFLLVPRLWTSILFRAAQHGQYVHWPYLFVGVIAAWVSLGYIGSNLPSTNTYESSPKVEGYKSRQQPFINLCLITMAISAAAFAVFFWLQLGPGKPPLELYQYFVLTVGIIIVPWFIAVIKILNTPQKRVKHLGRMLLFATALIVLAQIVTGYLLRYTMSLYFLPGDHTHPLLYATFAVPLILLLMSVGGTLIAGFTSRFTDDDDQEWWARTGAWMFILIIGWIAVHFLVLYGPLLILTLGTTYYRIKSKGLRNLPWSDIGKIAGTTVGIVSGIITLLGGFSAKTPANAKEAEKAGFAGMALSILTLLAAPIFLAFVFISISLGTNWFLVSSVGRVISKLTSNVILPTAPPISSAQIPLATDPATLPDWHTYLLIHTPLLYLLAVVAVLIILTVFMGRLINTNSFSLQYMWRNRIIRACLGASRRAGTRRPNPFTGFDPYDNLLMHELRPQPTDKQPEPLKGRPPDDLPPWRKDPTGPLRPRKLMHVLNLALNLTGGKKLQWQDRRAESFTVSPLHAGSYWLGYRRSYCYGGQEGISLGAAIAISGAFASPNMGYMMTSPVVRFLMALFNFRFGAWLGNPGPAGEKTRFIESIANLPLKLLSTDKDMRPFRLRSPSLSVIPIVSEAFGNIDDESSYVYLSDGGHFENLGLYEMVVRRCRFIVVSDASSDAEYAFQSLAMAVRQIRIDLGVPIVLPEFAVTQPAQDLKNKYCARGTIRYSCVDRDPNDVDSSDEDFDGVLIYIKPSLIGEEPRDVINYWQGSDGFPQETITDQWFNEAQFESYRALGSHIIDAICDPENLRAQNQVSFTAFSRKVFEHNQLDFRAFRESLSYFALENQSTATLTATAFPTFKKKVERFIGKLLD